MVYDVVPQSVHIKTTVFEKPAKLINSMELAAAVGMAYGQAGLPLLEAEEGEDVREFRDRAMESLKGKTEISPKLLQAIQSYVFKKGERISEDALMTLRLGYQFRG